jgi:flagellar basal body rod protein FlgG
MLNAAGELITPEGTPLLDANGKLTIEPNWTMPVGSKS